MFYRPFKILYWVFETSKCNTCRSLLSQSYATRHCNRRWKAEITRNNLLCHEIPPQPALHSVEGMDLIAAKVKYFRIVQCGPALSSVVSLLGPTIRGKLLGYFPALKNTCLRQSLIRKLPCNCSKIFWYFCRCVLNWFGDWSTGALYQVGKEFTSKIDLEKSNVRISIRCYRHVSFFYKPARSTWWIKNPNTREYCY